MTPYKIINTKHIAQAKRRKTCNSCLGNIMPGTPYTSYTVIDGERLISNNRIVKMCECKSCMDKKNEQPK